MNHAQFAIGQTNAPANAAADVNGKVTALFPQQSDDAVDSALDMFNRMSRQITDSYRTLESRVNQLSGELSEESLQRQQELEKKEQLADQLTTLLKALPAGVVVLDSQGVVTQTNPAAVGLLGEPLDGEHWIDVIQRCFAPRQDDGHEISLKDGRRVSIEIRTMENQPGQLILLTDMTETRQLQSQLAHAQRLSAMGKMVASLAHQIRTPLSAAILYGGHLTEADLDEEMRQRCANRLMSRLSHLEQQVRDMLIFARGETRLAEELSVITLAVALKSAVDAIAERSGAELILDARGAEGHLLCNRDALVGACTNLVNNSIEAGATSVRLDLSGCDHELAIEVSDNGPGFDPAMAPRLQEAFYTTKSQGTGLGLAVVLAVVNAHQGRFAINSNGQGGAQAMICLPLLNRTN
ncbi:ATP-binding protein [Marinobacter sp. M3C]|jgi:two-component system sensor histidine kinase FlrB|uniref:sensor histidine kinase n=1 Tax=unclassified Marinobacter TaxID=83889 RepID=UPI00200E7655|nr:MULTISPECIES: ATP-binding protein [unclassified Marinobacter]MCL1479137.1 ATP-binding protein [Marinobacter sp.]MCL1485070.1 ATP-binding protein [Marinobacter sp.]MCL1488897.1 ATP-binding protein [Marinobacter sp.]UQG57208.1 ATP-binding protein [Marinobacter sp. M4C]UQG61609.1 ATP-binding protein [Marinobacter sp. M3C]